MKRFTKLAVATSVGAATMGFGATASAQPLVTGGLVNVTVTDSLNDVISIEDVNLGVGLNVAANVCDVNVNVLAEQLRSGGAECMNENTGDIATITRT